MRNNFDCTGEAGRGQEGAGQWGRGQEVGAGQEGGGVGQWGRGRLRLCINTDISWQRRDVTCLRTRQRSYITHKNKWPPNAFYAPLNAQITDIYPRIPTITDLEATSLKINITFFPWPAINFAVVTRTFLTDRNVANVNRSHN